MHLKIFPKKYLKKTKYLKKYYLQTFKSEKSEQIFTK